VFGITGFKLIIILIAGLILIGPDKMPEIARTIGKGMRMFNAAKDDMERMIKADMFASENPAQTIIGTPGAASSSSTAASAGTTVASTLYDDNDDEEEEEE
jgi:sec-independent protein translocase protein TatA